MGPPCPATPLTHPPPPRPSPPRRLQVFEAQGVFGTIAESESWPQAEQDYHQTLSEEGKGLVLMQHDPRRSCLLRHIKR